MGNAIPKSKENGKLLPSLPACGVQLANAKGERRGVAHAFAVRTEAAADTLRTQFCQLPADPWDRRARRVRLGG